MVVVAKLHALVPEDQRKSLGKLASEVGAAWIAEDLRVARTGKGVTPAV